MTEGPLPRTEPTAAIGRDVVPRVRPQVTLVPVADEAIIYDEESGALHRLDAVATSVCALLDGETSIGAAVERLTEMYGADPDVIEVDVLALVERLDQLDVLSCAEVPTGDHGA